MKITELLRKNRLIRGLVHSLRAFGFELQLYLANRKSIRKGLRCKGVLIYYLGAPIHANLGDLAQGVCIRRWLKEEFPTFYVVEIQNDAIVNNRFSVLPMLKKKIREQDLIVFQSGYTTTDLGGRADEMHRKIIEAFPDKKMLMMPQTIFFKDERNRNRTAEIYNTAGNMLFLARDKVSYQMAREMFPDIRTALFPDIVTTWIGKYDFADAVRDGVLFCLRDDTEKFYSDEELAGLMDRFRGAGKIERCDTSKRRAIRKVVKHAEQYIFDEIEHYSQFKLVITDRYHGTIFSLIAGTPVVIIKSTDHKVITGADWFKGIYDEYVYVADSLEDAYEKGRKILKHFINHKLPSHFKDNYYVRLKSLWLGEKTQLDD